jgi:hypothetical protein
LILPVGLSGSLPEFVGAADNFHFKGSFHFRCFRVRWQAQVEVTLPFR